MGLTNSNKKVDKCNTLLNIYVCNSNKQINKIKFIEEEPNNNLNQYRHKFYGWNFYDYGKDIDDNKIKDIRDKIISEAKKKIFKMFYYILMIIQIIMIMQ